MGKEYDEELCNQRGKYVDDKLELHDKRLNDHSTRIKKLEEQGIQTGDKLDSLCDQLKNLISTIKWVMGILIGGWVSFFIYLLQLHIK